MIEENKIEEQDENYKIKLENFEGPLDLLLSLIKDAQMDIFEIKLADITEQYLEYMKQIDTLDMEKASGFIVIAATLIEIKSKQLLPKEVEEVLDPEDPEVKLKQQIAEYKLFKEASQKLGQIEEINRMYKEPDKQADKCRIILKDMVLDKLLDAFVGILEKVERKEVTSKEKEIIKDRFTVAEKIVQIRQCMQENHQMKFSDFFAEDQTRSEVINIFLALLELLKLQVVKAVQNGNFEEITIISNQNLGEENG